MRPRRTLTRRLALAAVVSLLLLAVACTNEEDSQEREPVRDDDGQVLDSTEVEALRVQVGDCFSGAIPFTMDTIEVVPCTQAHDHEVYAIFDVDPTPDPAETTTTTAGGEQGDDAAAEEGEEGEEQTTTTSTDPADEEWPGDARVQELGERGCLIAFGEYVGAPYEVSALEIGLILPTQESWEVVGDREAVCAVHRADGTPLTASVQGTGL